MKKEKTDANKFSTVCKNAKVYSAEHFDVPFCTLSHSRKISSPPLTLPLFLLTRQILSSAVFGAPGNTKNKF